MRDREQLFNDALKAANIDNPDTIWTNKDGVAMKPHPNRGFFSPVESTDIDDYQIVFVDPDTGDDVVRASVREVRLAIECEDVWKVSWRTKTS